MRRWWRSLGFYWQTYLSMAVCFCLIICLVEVVLDPMLEEAVEQWLGESSEWPEIIVWLIGALAPTLVMGLVMTSIVMRKMNGTVDMVHRLSRGDLGARIVTTGDKGDVFNRLAFSVNAMADSIERLLYHEKRLLADISHELRSPLTRMGVATALLPMKRNAADFDALVKTLDDEIDFMNRLVQTLLEQGRQRLEDTSTAGVVDLAALIQDVADAFRLSAQKSGKTLDVRTESGLAVWGHDVRVRMILENILSNALFYTPEGGSVRLEAARRDGVARITVRDHGPGVPDANLSDIFRPFFRVDASRARTSGGAGLGLTLAHDAAVALGGDIAARNGNPGLEVIVTLPIRVPDSAADPPGSS